MPEAIIKLKITFETSDKRISSALVEVEGTEALYDDNDDELDIEPSGFIRHFEEHIRRRIIGMLGRKGYRVLKIEKADTQ
jgi:hypothetical protein